MSVSRCSIFASLLSILVSFNTAPPVHADFLTLQPGAALGKDAQIMNGANLGSNTGASSDLITNVSGNLRSVGLIEFDLTGLPAGAVIVSASLSLFHHSNSNLNSRYDIFRVTSAWDEMTVTFESAPAFDATSFSTLIIPDAGIQVMRTWNITSLVQGWTNGTFSNFGMWIEEIPLQGSATAYFASSDHSNAARRPILQIEYISEVPTPSGLVLAGFGIVGVALLRRRSCKQTVYHGS